jgi:N-acyl-L-homoserine lactone synthetase
MIRLVQGHQRSAYPREIDAMHRLRRKVFHDRMGWDVSVIRQWEIDGFDVLDPLYLLSVDQNNRVVGTLRLLPTTGFTMINDVFNALLPDKTPIVSPLIWESSRFAVDHEADVPIGPNGISRATAELGLGMNALGMRLGLTHIVTVYDALVHRTLRRASCAGEPIGDPQRIGKSLAYAVFYEVGPETESRVRAVSGIKGEVLEDSVEEGLRLKVA